MITKITKKDRRDIKKLRENNTLQWIATKYGVSRERIRQICDKIGASKRTRVFVYSCNTPGCSNVLQITKELPEEKRVCRACQYYEYTHRVNPSLQKRKRYFELPQQCIDCGKPKGDGRKNYLRNGRCNRCHTRFWYRTHPEYREYLKERTRKGSPTYEAYVQYRKRWFKKHGKAYKEKLKKRFRTDPVYREHVLEQRRAYYYRKKEEREQEEKAKQELIRAFLAKK